MIPARIAGDRMKRFVEGVDRGQRTLFPDCLGVKRTFSEPCLQNHRIDEYTA
jgi:hypothetical protein